MIVKVNLVLDVNDSILDTEKIAFETLAVFIEQVFKDNEHIAKLVVAEFHGEEND